VCVWAASAVAADELGERRAVAQTVRQALWAGDFQTLEQLATTYRKEKARTSSGLWKLSLFYAGLETAMYPPDENATGSLRTLIAKPANGLRHIQARPHRI
jgi:hypothetical protein